MSTEESKKSTAATNTNSEMEDREQSRRENERAARQNLTQGFETGTQDSTHPGIKWPASYRTSEKRGKRAKRTPRVP